jgi:hypothetical protein
MPEQESEVLSHPQDKRRPESGLPRHHKERNTTTPPKRPALWNLQPAEIAEPPPLWGMYPRGFLELACKHLLCDPSEVLHVCSGGLSSFDTRGGIRVDIRRESLPDVVCDGRCLPFPDRLFRGVLVDPPYTIEYAKTLYRTDYPRPSSLLREALRVATPCGRVGFLHYLVPNPPPGARIIRILGLSLGCGYRIRAFTVFERDQDSLPGIHLPLSP